MSIFAIQWARYILSQTTIDEGSRTLIVGELIGKVDPDDLGQLIQLEYFQVSGKDARIELSATESSTREIVFRVYYPGAELSRTRVNRVIFQFFENEQNLIAALITERVDFAITESDETAEEIEKSTSAMQVLFRRKPANQVKQIAFNNQHPLLKNANIRKALSYAIDRNYIYARILRQVAEQADGPYIKESQFHISGLDEYKYHPRKAMQLLKAENCIDSNNDGVLDKDGMPLRIALTYEKGVRLEEQVATRIKIDWNKLGVEVVRNPMMKSEIKKMLQQKNYDAMLMSYRFEENIESLESVFQSHGKHNILGYQNRKVDQYFHNYKLAEPITQQVLFQAILNEINKDSPMAFLFFLWVDRYFVNRNKFKNFQDASGLLLPFTEWEFSK